MDASRPVLWRLLCGELPVLLFMQCLYILNSDVTGGMSLQCDTG